MTVIHRREWHADGKWRCGRYGLHSEPGFKNCEHCFICLLLLVSKCPMRCLVQYWIEHWSMCWVGVIPILLIFPLYAWLIIPLMCH